MKLQKETKTKKTGNIEVGIERKFEMFVWIIKSLKNINFNHYLNGIFSNELILDKEEIIFIPLP